MKNLRDEMATRSIADLTGLYNQAIDDHELAEKPIMPANKKEKAFKRVEKLMADHNLVLDYDSFSDTYVLAKGEGTPEPTAEEDAAAAFMAQPEPTDEEKAEAAGEYPIAEDDQPGAEGTIEPTPEDEAEAAPAKPAKPAKAKAKAKRKATASKATGAKRGPAPEFADDMVISVLVPNPKRPGSMAYDRYQNYEDGMTVAAALAAGLRRDDFRWDTDKGHIVIETAADYAAHTAQTDEEPEADDQPEGETETKEDMPF